MPTVHRSGTMHPPPPDSAPQTPVHSVLVRSLARDVHAHDLVRNSLPTKTTHVLVPVHHTHTATLHSPKTRTTQRVSTVGAVVLLVMVELGRDPVSHSDSTHVGGAKKTMTRYRNIHHFRPLQVR